MKSHLTNRERLVTGLFRSELQWQHTCGTAFSVRDCVALLSHNKWPIYHAIGLNRQNRSLKVLLTFFVHFTLKKVVARRRGGGGGGAGAGGGGGGGGGVGGGSLDMYGQPGYT